MNFLADSVGRFEKASRKIIVVIMKTVSGTVFKGKTINPHHSLITFV